jgi:tRNA G18 (ribose-2'-O)-methylase SpoU
MNTNSVEFFKNNESAVSNANNQLILAAWQLRNAGNIGKIIRLAHNVSATKVLFINDTEQHRESKIKKTAGFSFDQMNWEFVSPQYFIDEYVDQYPLTVLETCTGATDIFRTQFLHKTILLAGSESHGIPEQIISKAKQKVYIPMPGACKSMNVSNALAVAAFEWYRQCYY